MQIAILLAVIVMGFSGIIGQVLLLREFLVTFLGNEISLGIIISNWLILEAFGSYVIGKKIEKQNNKVGILVFVQLIFSIFLPIAIYLSRTIKTIIGVPHGEALGIIPIFCISFGILAVVSITHGALFTFFCSIYHSTAKNEQNTKSVGRVYISETIGTLVGGGIITYLLIPHFHSIGIAFGIAVINVAVCLLLLIIIKQDGQLFNKFMLYVSSICFGLLLIAVFLNIPNTIHRNSIDIQWYEQEVLFYENSVYGNVVVTKKEEQYTFFSNAIPIIATPMPNIAFVEEFVHLPMLHHSKPKEILIISGGAGGVINEVLKYSIRHIDYVELDPLILTAIKKFPSKLTATELSSAMVHTHHQDGRYFLRTTVNRYDIVFIGLSNPQDLQMNRLFTKEFFALVKEKLNPTGIVVVSLPGSLTYLSRELKNLNRCIKNTLLQIFSSLKVIPGDGMNLFLASDCAENFTVSTEILIQRLCQNNMNLNLITPYYLNYKFSEQWSDWFERSIKDGTEKINTDFHPMAVFYSLAYWNALFAPAVQKFYEKFETLNLIKIAAFMSILTLIFVILQTKIKRTSKAAIPLCITSTGFAGMLFNLIILFAFQSLYGYVFYWIGIMSAVIMFGIATGAHLTNRLLERMKNHIHDFIRIEICFILFSIALPVILIYIKFLSLAPEFLLLPAFICGLFVGLEFPLANRILLSVKKDADLSGTAGLLYGADLFGGWTGGILGGVILLPVIGILGACFLIVFVKFCTFLILCISLYICRNPLR